MVGRRDVGGLKEWREIVREEDNKQLNDSWLTATFTVASAASSDDEHRQ
jgi:hypothetical protein